MGLMEKIFGDLNEKEVKKKNTEFTSKDKIVLLYDCTFI